MRADRFGSYSTVAMRAGTPCLSRLKSMPAVVRLLAAAAMAHGEPALVVPAGAALLRLEQRLVRLGRS